jgi:hypothetical protein
MLVSDPLFYAAAVPAVLLFGISKGGFGGGLGILAVPLLSLIVSPVQAAAILLPVLCCLDLIGLWAYRGKWDIHNLRILIPASILGIIIGTLLFRYMSEELIKLLLGIIAILFTLDYWFRPAHGAAAAPARPNVLFGSIAAAVGGFTSFIAHSGGPPISMYLLPQRMQRTRFVATTVLLFAVINYVKLIPYSWLGLFHGNNLLTSLVLVPAAVIGFLAGIWLHNHVSEALFYRVCYVFLLIVGIKLVLDSAGIHIA